MSLRILGNTLTISGTARRVGWVCERGARLEIRDGRAVCGSCDRRYREVDPESLKPEIP